MTSRKSRSRRVSRVDVPRQPPPRPSQGANRPRDPSRLVHRRPRPRAGREATDREMYRADVARDRSETTTRDRRRDATHESSPGRLACDLKSSHRTRAGRARDRARTRAGTWRSGIFLATPPATGGTRRLADMARARVCGERRGEARAAAGRLVGGRETRNRAFERIDARGRAVCDYVVLHYRYYLWCARCVR